MGRRDQTERRHALGMVERHAQRGVRAHRGAGEQRALHAERVEQLNGVARQVLVGIGPLRGRRGGAMGAGVIGDHAHSGALQGTRPHHD